MIHKRSINLILKKEHAAPLTLRLNRVAIRVAAGSLAVFCLVFVMSAAYLRIQYAQFNAIRRDVQDFEQRISQMKTVEGLATIASEKLTVLERLSTINRRYSRLLNETLQLQTGEIQISTIAVGKDRSMSFAVVAQSSGALSQFVETLIQRKEDNLYTDINATGIIRDRNGLYSLTITLKPDVSIFQQL